MHVLALNLGSTSTKVGVFTDRVCILEETIRHDKEALVRFPSILLQQPLRQRLLEELLTSKDFDLAAFDMYAVRCGLIRPVAGGAWYVNDAVIQDAVSGAYGEHAANIGLLIAKAWSDQYGVPAVFIDAPVTDELNPLARYSGYAGYPRRSVFHALNARRVVHLYCRDKGLDPARSNFIVAHMGGGITVSAWKDLKAIDVTNGVDGEGPFSPERVGALSHVSVLKLLADLGGDPKAVRAALYTKGGLQSYLGTNDVRALCGRAAEEPEAKQVLDAMLYTIRKSIGAMAAVLEGRVQAVLLTGGLAYNQGLMDDLKSRLAWLAPCAVYPGEDELAALHEGALRCLNGEEEAKTLV